MARLGEVCTKITDGSHNPPQGVSNSEYLMLSSKNIYDDEITLDDPRFLSAENYATENKRTQISTGDILLTIVGTVGRAAVVSDSIKNICLQRSVAVIKPKSGIIDSRFLMYQLQSMRTHLEKEARGVAQKGIYLKQVENLQIKVPSLDEQLGVVNKLDKVSKLITLRKEQLAKLDELVKARFVEMFGDPVTNSMGWPIHQLSEHILFLTSGSRGWAQYFTEQGEYFITIKNVKNCRIALNDVQHIVPPNNAEAARTKVQEGDLLISITADLGRTGVVSKEIAEHGAYINQHLTCIRLDKSALNPLYVAYYMESEAGKTQFQAKNQNGVKAGLNFNAINSLRLFVPPLELQEKFTSFVEQTDRTKLTIQAGLDKLVVMKKALMQECFR